MAEEVKEQITDQKDPVQQNNQDKEFLEQLKEIKEKMVDKAEFDKISEDNRKLKEALMNSLASVPNQPDVPASKLAEEYIKMAEENKCSLEMAKQALALRNQVLKETNNKVDVFMNADIRKQDPMRGQRVADFLEQAIKQSNGSSHMFSAFLNDNLRESDTSKAINMKLQNK